MENKAKLYNKMRRVWAINPRTRIIPNKKKVQEKYACRKSRQS